MTNRSRAGCYAAALTAAVLGTHAIARARGYDLFLYQRMAHAALIGHNPFTDLYADFPPLKMAAFVVLEQVGGWTAALLVVAAAHAYLTARYVQRRCGGFTTPAVIALLPTLVPAVFLAAWYRAAWEDKGVYAVLVVAALLAVPDGPRGLVRISTRHAVAVGAAVGVLQSYGGGGLLVVPFVAAAAATDRTRRTVQTAGAAVAVLVVTHLVWFPAWVEGYQHRLHRVSTVIPEDSSFLRFASALGVYTHVETAAVLVVCGAGLAWGFWTRRLSLHQAMALAAGLVLLIGPDMSYDRILAGSIPLLAVGARRWQFTIPAVMMFGLVGLWLHGLDPRTLPALAVCWVPVVLAVAAVLTSGGDVLEGLDSLTVEDPDRVEVHAPPARPS